MTKVLINYATPDFRRSQRVNLRSGVEIAGFDRAIGYRTADIDREFYRQNRHILNYTRGVGYWLWKPYFVVQTLRNLNTGDFLFYSDAGSIFMEPIDHLTKLALKHENEVMVFSTVFVEKQWTKRDAFLLVGCDSPKYTETLQRAATFSLWRKSAYSMEVAEQWLHYCQDRRIITDEDNVLGLPNYPEFSENRHDQTVLSLITKLRKITAYRPLHAKGNSVKHLFPNSPYPQIMNLTRRSHNSVAIRLARRYEQYLRRYKGGVRYR